MIDALSLPNAARQIVYVGTEVSGLPPINIQVPKAARFVFFTIIGGGGGGGRPTAGAAARGGSGGGVGGITHGLFMAKELPPMLYGYISRRGAGGTTNGSNGGNGLGVHLAAVAGTSAPNARDVLLFANGGGGGQAAGTTGGSAGAAATVANMMLSTSALWVNSTAGVAGSISSVTSGSSVSIAISNFCSPGAGGGGSSGGNGGGQVSASELYPSLPSSAGVGLDGYIVQRPFICIGGCGGRGTTGATGSAGGNGAYIGAGGGGGGNGTTTSGNGGNGGSGAIIMRWW